MNEADKRCLVPVGLSKAGYAIAVKAAEVYGREVEEIILSGAMSNECQYPDYNYGLVDVISYCIRKGWATFGNFSDALSLAERFKAAQPLKEVAIAPISGGYTVSYVVARTGGERIMHFTHEAASVPKTSEIL
jgi:hypothetical protein